MNPSISEQARRLEAILPLILRTIYPPREDDPFAELPLMQLRVIRTLSQGPRTMSELADDLHMSASRLAHLVTRLQTVGLVEKHCHSDDRRVKSVELTELGATQMQTHQNIRSERAADILSSLGEQDRENLMSSLEGLYRQAQMLKPTIIREPVEISR